MSDGGFSSNNVIHENDYVIVERVYEDKTRIAKVVKDGMFYWGQLRMDVSGLINTEFDSLCSFDNKTRKLSPVTMSEEELFEIVGITSDINPGELDNTKDNRDLHDDGRSQKLSLEEIEGLKSGGLTNKQIVDTIVDNSSTFQDKSAFAQEKYLKKKKQKYSNYFKIHRPTVRLLCDMYHVQNPPKICNMRVETLSQMLTACNVRSGGNYMVVDNSIGLMTAAVLERLIGIGDVPVDIFKGTCTQIVTEPGPLSSWRQCVESLNVTADATTDHLLSLQIKQVYNILHDIKEEDRPIRQENNGAEAEGDYVDPKRRKLDERAKRKGERKLEELKAKELLSLRSMDGLLVVISKVEPTSILEILLEFLAPSAPFAIFCSVMEPLTQCAAELKMKKCVNLKLSETWLRKYQVLPGRTRPLMNMSGSGGFLLTGIKIL